MTEPAKTTAVDDARKDEYEDEIVWPAPKIGPRMPCMSQERYDNLIAAEAKVAELEEQLRQEREEHQQTVQDRNMLAARIIYGEGQVAQLQATMGQLRKAAQKMTACHHDTCAATLSTVAAYPCSCGKDELLAALATCPAPSQEKPQP